MPVFRNADQLDRVFTAVTHRWNAKSALAHSLADLDLVVRFTLTDLGTDLTLDWRRLPLAAQVGFVDTPATLELQITSHVLHDLFLGRQTLQSIPAGHVRGDLTRLSRVQTALDTLVSVYTSEARRRKLTTPPTPPVRQPLSEPREPTTAMDSIIPPLAQPALPAPPVYGLLAEGSEPVEVLMSSPETMSELEPASTPPQAEDQSTPSAEAPPTEASPPKSSRKRGGSKSSKASGAAPTAEAPAQAAVSAPAEEQAPAPAEAPPPAKSSRRRGQSKSAAQAPPAPETVEQPAAQAPAPAPTEAPPPPAKKSGRSKRGKATAPPAPPAEEHAAETPVTEAPAPASVAEAPAAASVADAPAAASVADAPAAASVADAPAAASVTEAPAAASVTEAPAAASVTEAPAPASVAEAPAAASVAEAPAAASVAEAPAQAPVVDQPVVATSVEAPPSVEEQVAEATLTETPAPVEEHPAEAPTAEQTVEPPVAQALPAPSVEEQAVETTPAPPVEEQAVEAPPSVEEQVAEATLAEAPAPVEEHPAEAAAPAPEQAVAPRASAPEPPPAPPAPPQERRPDQAPTRPPKPPRPPKEQPKGKPQPARPAPPPPAPALPPGLADALAALNHRLIPLVEGEAPPRKLDRLDQALPTEETPLRLEMLRRLTLIRAVETRLTEEANAGHLPAPRLALSQGQEGVAVGACFALRPDDNLVVTHRALGYFLARGSDPAALVAEVYGKSTGVCGGKAGPDGLIDARVGAQATAILGASTVLATGWGLAAKLRGTDQVTLCIVGEGASNQGMFHEALNFAAVRDLPVVFVIVNDGDIEAARATGSARLDSLAQRAVAYGIGNVTVDGTDAWAVYRSVRAAVKLARSGGGPTLVEARLTPRQEPDAKKKDAPKERLDPLVRLYNTLVDSKLLTPAEARELAAAAQLQSDRAVERAQAAAPPAPEALTTHVYSPEPDFLYRPAPMRIAPRELTYAAAINEALSVALHSDPQVFVIGSDLAGGGRFETGRGLQARFGVSRVIDAPVSPNAIVGSAVSAAAAGFRPVVDLGSADLLALAADPIINHAAKLRYITAGQYRAPLVVRVASGPAQGLGPQQTQSLEAWLASIPGLLVVAPSTPYEAKGLLLAAVRSNNPVLFFEAKALYPLSGQVPADRYIVPLGVADIKRSGNDCTVVAIGAAVHEALAAAETLAEEGISVEVVDPRSLAPFDWATTLGSVARTGRLVIVEEAPLTLNWGAEIAAQAAAHLHGRLRAPVERVTAAPTPLPYSPALARLALAGADQIMAAVRRVARG